MSRKDKAFLLRYLTNTATEVARKALSSRTLSDVIFKLSSTPDKARRK